MFVPALLNNLISVSTITDNGYTMIFDKHRTRDKTYRRTALITHTALTAKRRINSTQQTKNQTMATYNINDNKLTRWHQRYGHLNVTECTDLKNLKVREIVTGVEFSTKASDFGVIFAIKIKYILNCSSHRNTRKLRY